MNARRRTLRVGTRGSALALRQTEAILTLMRARCPELDFETVQVVTHGDRFSDKPIAEMGEEVDKGIFNTALEEAVLSGEVDLSTCSFKDVESELRPALRAVTVARREDHRDTLVSRHGVPLSQLPHNAVLGTSSPRRVSQLKAFRPDFRFVPLRGNVATRVERDSQRFDGVILAAAGLIRLSLSHRVAEWIDESVLLPAPAQGALGCEYREDNAPVDALVRAIQDPATELCARTEKALLVRLSGGCFAPIGVLARIAAGRLSLQCRIASLDGAQVVEHTQEGRPEEADALVDTAARSMEERGALEIVRAVREALQPARA
ncbi:MAG: hydroxymethylbilane synthase [SAR324 cluster bacterium]|nr:hydroxymethylbilane synthase [SAR324 cluster bacterium]